MRFTASINCSEDEDCGDKAEDLFHIFEGLGLSSRCFTTIAGQTYYGISHDASIYTRIFYVKLRTKLASNPVYQLEIKLKNNDLLLRYSTTDELVKIYR